MRLKNIDKCNNFLGSNYHAFKYIQLAYDTCINFLSYRNNDDDL